MKRNWMMAAFVVLLCAASADAATWYVNNVKGKNTNDGRSEATAFAAIAAAVAHCGQSDTLVLANTGTPYRESITLIQLGGTPAAPFRIIGNGAVISGFERLDATKWQQRDNGAWFYPWPDRTIDDPFAGRQRRITPFLMVAGRKLPFARELGKLAPGQYCWADEGVWFRPEAGRTAADYAIDITARVSGLEVVDSSYVHCSDLIAEGFLNDGFNIHGKCQGIYCENIVARFNGDDGFSIHEDISAVVFNAYLHDNDNGVQDVNASRSVYFGVRAERNRLSGIALHGGLHLLVDSQCKDNLGAQVLVLRCHAKHIGLTDDNIATTGLSMLKNVQTSGGKFGLLVQAGGRVAATDCSFTAAETGVSIAKGGLCHLTASSVTSCRKAELDSAADDVLLDGNTYFPGRLVWKGRAFGPDEWEAYRRASGQDGNSRIAASEVP